MRIKAPLYRYSPQSALLCLSRRSGLSCFCLFISFYKVNGNGTNAELADDTTE
jgi:hypothetical protein